MCIYVYVYMCMYISIYVYMYTRIFVYMYICIYVYMYTWHVQVVPGRAGGGSFRGKNDYKPKTEFAYRMCAGRPTSAMPKRIFCVCTSGQKWHPDTRVKCSTCKLGANKFSVETREHPLCWKFLQFFSRKVLGQKRASCHFFTTKYLDSKPLKALGFCWQDRGERKDTVPSSMNRSSARALIKCHECKK